MLEAFPEKEKKVFKKKKLDIRKINMRNKLEAATKIPCSYGLERLSGKKCVNYEEFDFRCNGNGTHHILVNGKITGCWIDNKDTIGGGSTYISNWLYYYCKDWKLVIQLLEEYFAKELSLIRLGIGIRSTL